MRRVLVTGGGSGIGRAIAHEFSAQGDHVVVAGRRLKALEETAAGNNIDVRICDVTSERDTEALFDAPFDVVVANAGGAKAAKVLDTSLENWNATLSVNLTGVFLTFKGALKTMKPGGRLIAISSIAGLHGAANISAYCASKHGVIGLVKSLAKEVAKQGITCNAVCPGYVDTPLARQGIDGLMERFGMSEEEAIAKMVSGNPIGRMIELDEVSSTVLFLASQKAAMINGHSLVLSGGEI